MNEDDVHVNNVIQRREQSSVNKELSIFQQQAAHFVLGLKERNCLTQVVVDDILDGSRRLLEQNERLFAVQLLEIFQNTEDLSHENICRIVSDVQSNRQDPFQNIDSAYRQNKYFNRVLQVIQPHEIFLGERAVRKLLGHKWFIMSKMDYSYYVPIIDNIKDLLKNERILNMVLFPPHCIHHDEGYLVDFCCGDVLRQHTILTNDKSIPILLYYDEIDVCNPIGTRATIHKLGMFYFSVGGIERKFRSRLSAIRLLSITSSENIKRYGIDQILEPLYADMIKLSEGVQFCTIDGENNLIRSALLAVVADTPASHQLGGFKEGVGGAYAKCRHCECSEDDMQIYFEENDFHERTIQTHIQYSAEIDNAITAYMESHLRTTYGINRRSILVDFPGFNVTRMLPQDIMHVVLEGVAQHEIKLVLQHLVEKAELDFSTVKKK